LPYLALTCAAYEPYTPNWPLVDANEIAIKLPFQIVSCPNFNSGPTVLY
jgi:hypothetical protein